MHFQIHDTQRLISAHKDVFTSNGFTSTSGCTYKFTAEDWIDIRVNLVGEDSNEDLGEVG